MAVFTPRYHFEKPDSSEYYDVSVFNANMDKAETILGALEDDLPNKAPADHGHDMEDVDGLPEALGARATTAIYTAVVPITGWTPDTNQYIREISVPGIVSTDSPIIDIVRSSVADDREAQLGAWLCVELITTAADTITLYAAAVPETELTLQIKVVR